MIKISSLVTSIGTFPTVYLLNDEPDWGLENSYDFELISNIERGLTGRETRRPHAQTMRCKFKNGITAVGQDARAMAKLLRECVNEPVAIPCSPLAVRWADRAARPATCGLYVVYKADWSTYEIYETSEPGWPASDDMVAPLLWGFLSERNGRYMSPNIFGLAVDFQENSAAEFALVPASATWADGPLPSGSWSVAPKVLPFQIHFEQLRHEVTIETVRRERIGFSRKTTDAVYPPSGTVQTTRRTEIAHVSTSVANVGQALRWFYDHGAGAAFWAPSYTNAAVLTAQLSAAGTTVTVEDTRDIAAGDWLAFISPGGMRAMGFAKVQSTTSTTITLVAAVGSIQPVDDTFICHLYLCRFKSPQFSVSFLSREAASFNFPIVEVPAEITPAADEALGATLGALKGRAFLYEFMQGGVTIERWTSNDRNLQDTAGSPATFQSIEIEHGEVRQGLFLDRDEVTIKTRGKKPDGSNMELFTMMLGRSEEPLFLAIRQEDIDPITGKVPAVGNYIFTGEVLGPGFTGGWLTARVASAGSLFDRKIPRFRHQLDCNVPLFSPPCGLVKTDWKFQCTVSGAPPTAAPYLLNVASLARVTGAAPTYFQNWFAGGFAEFGKQRRAILASTTPSGGSMAINLDRAFQSSLVNGSTLYLYPGCDSRRATCRAYHATNNPEGKFDNFLNFRGHPETPGSNPTIAKVSQGAGGGKK